VPSPRALLIRAWRWWTGELAGLVPPAVRRAVAGQGDDTWLLVRRDGLFLGRAKGRATSGAAHAEPRRLDPIAARPRTAAARPVAVYLDPDLVLLTELTLPLAAAANLRAILGHHLGLLVPLAPRELIFDHVVAARDAAAQTVRVSIAITKVATIDAARDAATQHGFVPEKILLHAPELARSGRGEPKFDFLRHASLTSSRPRRRLPRLLEAVLLVLVLAALGARLWNRDQDDARLAAAIARMREAAQATTILRDQADRLAEPLRLLQSRAAAPPPLKLLADLTDLLPDNTSVSLLRMQGQTLQVSGISRRAAGLIAGFETSARFENARFQSPVTSMGDGTEHFDLVVTIKPPAASQPIMPATAPAPR
jgi:general secretion pathway protein L